MSVPSISPKGLSHVTVCRTRYSMLGLSPMPSKKPVGPPSQRLVIGRGLFKVGVVLVLFVETANVHILAS